MSSRPDCACRTHGVPTMIWIFKRGEESLRLEARYDNEND
jgi:hypothetical protein